MIIPYFRICLLAITCFACCKNPQPAINEDGFTQIFNGKDLTGWDGDTLYWKVEEGNLVGEVTPSTLLSRNTFIIWRGGEVADFELKVQYRITADGNSGINYRSEELKDLPHAMKGYQGDIDGKDNYTGMNYEERGRTTLARRGQKIILPPVSAEDPLTIHIDDNVWAAGMPAGVTGKAEDLKAAINSPGSWNEYHIIAKGNHLQHFINNVLMCEVTDNDAAHAKMRGLIGVQVHVGPPMKVAYRNFLLKKL